MNGPDIVTHLELNKDKRARYSHMRNFNPKKLRLIFLDFDGVLNSIKTYVVHGKYPLSNDDRKEGEPYVLDNHAWDHVAIGLVNQLCKVTGAYIVLSTSWRDQFNFHQTIEMCAEIGLKPEYIIGRTDRWGDSKFRGLQIERFLERIQKGKDEVQEMNHHNFLCSDFVVDEPIVVESFVIFDDLDDYYIMTDNLAAWFIRTDNREGLTLKNVTTAGGILTDDMTFYIKQLQGKKSAGDNGFVWK